MASERSFRTFSSFDDTKKTSVNSRIIEKYASLDRKFVLMLKRIEKITFGALYAMVQENSFRIKFSIWGVIIDFLQIYAFTLSSDFGFGSEYEVVSSFLLAPLQLLTWTAFEVIFWIVVIIITSSLLVSYYVGYTFVQSDFTVVWPIKYLRTMVNLILSVLFIPCLTVLVVPLKEDHSNGLLKHFVKENIVAWGPFITPYAIISILLMVLFVPFCLLMGLLSFEFAPNTKDIMARHSSWLDFVYLVLKTLLVFVTNFAASDPASVAVRASIIFFATLFVTVYLVVYCCYYQRYMNLFRAGLFSALLGAAAVTAVKAYIGLQVVEQYLTSLAIFGIHAAATIVFGGLGTLVMYVKLNSRITGNPYKYVTAKNAASKRQSFIGANVNNVPASPATSHRGSDVSMNQLNRPSRRKKGGTGLITTASMTGGETAQVGTVKRLFQRLRNFGLGAELQLRILFLRVKETSDDTTHLADTVFLRMIDQYRQVPILHIHYANFLISYKHDWIAASAQVRKAEVIGAGFTHRWLTFGIWKRIDREKRSTLLGSASGSLNLMKYVEFQHVLSKARRAHLESLRFLRHFWESLSDETGDRQLARMSKAQIEAGVAQSRALHAYCKLIASFPNSPLLWRSYSAFLTDVCSEHDEAQTALQTADDLEERQAQHNAQASRYVERGPAPDTMLRNSTSNHSATLYPIAENNAPEDSEPHRGDTTATNDEFETQSDAGKKPRRDRVADVQRQGDLDSEGSEHSMQSLGTRSRTTANSHTTGTSATSATTLSRRLIQQMSAGAGAKRLNRRFIQAFSILVLLVIVNFIVTRVLIDGQIKQVRSSESVIFLRQDTILASIAAAELGFDYYLNSTGLGLDKTKWKIIPEGYDGHIAEVNSFIRQVINKTDELLGESGSVGWGVDKVWQQAQAQMYRFVDGKDGKEYNVTLKEAIDTWKRAVTSVIDSIKNKYVEPSEIMGIASFPTMFINGLEEVGGTHAHLGKAYREAIESSTLLLQIIILCVAGVSVGIGIGLIVFIIRPSIHESHFEEHLVHILILLVPVKYIDTILQRIFKCEMDLRQQMADAGGDSDEEDAQVTHGNHLANLEAEQQAAAEEREREREKRAKKQKSHWLIRSSNVEGSVYQESLRQEKRCRGMRSIGYMYFFAIGAIMAIIVSQCVLFFATMSEVIIVIRTMEEAGGRLEMATGTYGFSYMLPSKMDYWAMEYWKQGDPHLHLAHELHEMQISHNAVSYGSAEKGITGTHEYIEKHQLRLVNDIIKPGISQFIDATLKLIAMNQSTIMYDNREYEKIHELFSDQSKDTLRSALEQSVQEYMNYILLSLNGLNLTNVTWLTVEIVGVVVVYFLIVRQILSILNDRDEAYLRALKTLPVEGIAQTPLLIDFLRDKGAFIERIRDRSKQDAEGGLDSNWTERYIKSSPDAFLVVNHEEIILEANKSAEKMFGNKELRQKKSEILTAPAYRTVLRDIARSLDRVEYAKKGVTRRIMAARSDGSQFPVYVTAHHMDENAVKSSVTNTNTNTNSSSESKRKRSKVFVLIFRKVEEESPIGVAAVGEGSGGKFVQAAKSLITQNARAHAHAQDEATPSSPSPSLSPCHTDVVWNNTPMVIIGLNGVVKSISKMAMEMLKKTGSEVKGKQFYKLFGSANRSNVEKLLEECMASPAQEMSRNLTVGRVDEDGDDQETLIRVSVTATTYSESSEAKQVVAVLEDRSDYQAIHNALLSNERMQASLLSGIPVGVISIDKNSQITIFNDAASTALGQARGRVLGQPISILFADPIESWLKESMKNWVTVSGRTSRGNTVLLRVHSVAISSAAASVSMNANGKRQKEKERGREENGHLVFVQKMSASPDEHGEAGRGSDDVPSIFLPVTPAIAEGEMRRVHTSSSINLEIETDKESPAQTEQYHI